MGGREKRALGTTGAVLAGAVVILVVILAVTIAGAVAVTRLDRTRASERLTDDAQVAALRAADGVKTVVGTLETQVQNGTANPRLAAALDAKVDDETLRDLMFNEPWWEPFRRAVDGFGLYSDETSALVTARLPAGFSVGNMVHDARAFHRTSSGLMVASGRVLAVVVAPIPLASRTDWPVLVATKAVDTTLLSALAERGGASVAVADGPRLLVASAKGPGSGPDELAPFKAAADLPTPGVELEAGVAVAAQPLAPDGLRILAALAPPAAAHHALPIPALALVILTLGGGLGTGTFLLLARRASAPAVIALPGGDASPSTVGRYTLVEQIGLGGMAEVYAAVTGGEAHFRRPVVIKRLRPELSVDPNAVAQFCDEANLLAAFHHPNIVAVHDFGRWQNQYYLAEEYVPGRDLGRIIGQSVSRHQRALAPEVVAYVAHEVCKALDYAHTLTNERGRPLEIVHRDVSPDNIMISARGDVKLLDFGVVKAAEGRVTKTEVGVVKGNVTYMAPEQARGLEVDSRADLFSLALVMYSACTGHPLYAAHTTYGLLMQAGAGPGPDARTAIERLPAPFAAVVRRATEPELENRYATAREMAADLAAWAAHGAAATAVLVETLFGAELRDEAHRLATFPVDAAPETLAQISSR